MASKAPDNIKQLGLPKTPENSESDWKMYFKVLPDGHTQIRAVKRPSKKK